MTKKKQQRTADEAYRLHKNCYRPAPDRINFDNNGNRCLPIYWMVPVSHDIPK